jgi:hypothetical protein
MHAIRLREPWEEESLAGRRMYRRFFNQPTGLGPEDVVQLVIEPLPADAVVSLNGRPLPTDNALWNIAAQLQPRNEITIEVAGKAGGRPFGEVRLEIG